MGKSNTPNAAAGKTPGGYPYDSLSRCLRLGMVVRNHGGRDVPREVIADELALGSGSVNPLCSSAKSFGIVEGTSELSLTQDAEEYFGPTTSSSERRALLAFFGSPAVYKELIRRFDGTKLPDQKHMPNVVRRLGVSESWCGRVAASFVSTANELGLIDGSGHLRYGSAMHKAGRGVAGETVDVTQEEPTPETTGFFSPSTALPPGVPASSSIVPGPVRDYTSHDHVGNFWSYSEAGCTIKVETPDPLSRALWEKLKRYVGLLEPSEQPQGGSE